MSKLPIIDTLTFEKILTSLNFQIVRQKGSHVFYRHPDGRYTTLPHHKGTDISRPLIRSILKQINLNTEDFIKILRDKKV
ncbi:type II toxin-antitoxin system HicA family toxin [Aquiflexum sp.]|uniref:type II toxin-antitoxin system HicA family toxin n=1 Tax=Aquiflexum sp. TaxID=1872584 RepID=UPI0035943163